MIDFSFILLFLPCCKKWHKNKLCKTFFHLITAHSLKLRHCSSQSYWKTFLKLHCLTNNDENDYEVPQVSLSRIKTLLLTFLFVRYHFCYLRHAAWIIDEVPTLTRGFSFNYNLVDVQFKNMSKVSYLT